MVSILNDFLGTVLANAAVVPAGNSGSIDVFVTDTTQVIIDVNGYYAPQISLANGTAAAPSLTFAGDNTSGLYSSGAGTVNIAAGGSNMLTVSSTGVRIGTTPNYPLDVAGDLNIDGNLLFDHNVVLNLSQTSIGSVGLGPSALASSTNTSANNTAVGASALQLTTANSNTAVGALAMKNNTAGGANTAVGNFALLGNTTGGDNTAIGFNALQSNTLGEGNTAVGIQALLANLIGIENTAVGSDALMYNTGDLNTATGSGALFGNTAGKWNTGYGASALQNNSIGNLNTAVGYFALDTNQTGSNNIAIGTQAGHGLINTSNNIHIGSSALATDNGTVRIGVNGFQSSFFVGGVRGITTALNNAIPVMIDANGQLGTVSSSRRFKDDIQDMGEASHDLLRLRPVTFRYKKSFADGSKPIQYGLIAEEVAEVYPDLVARSADGQIETVKYQVLDSMLLNEVQRQQGEISSQKGQIRVLEQQNQDLQRRLARLEAALVSASGEPRVPQ